MLRLSKAGLFAVFSVLFASIFLVPLTTHALSTAADKMCHPFFNQCPCDKIPDPKNKTKCIDGGEKSNTAHCGTGVCFDVTNGHTTMGICPSEGVCKGITCDGKACEQNENTPKDQQGSTPSTNTQQPSTGSSGGSGGTGSGGADSGGATTPSTPSEEPSAPAKDSDQLNCALSGTCSGDTSTEKSQTAPSWTNNIDQLLKSLGGNTSSGFPDAGSVDTGSAGNGTGNSQSLEQSPFPVWGLEAVGLQPNLPGGGSAGTGGDTSNPYSQLTGFNSTQQPTGGYSWYESAMGNIASGLSEGAQNIAGWVQDSWNQFANPFGETPSTDVASENSAATQREGLPTNARTTFYAPGAGGSVEGGFETSRPNLEGDTNTKGDPIPKTLDDVRTLNSEYVTLASDPKNYGKFYDLGPVTYTSPIDGKTYTGDPAIAATGKAEYSENLSNVTGYVHDTGSAFQGRPDKFDVAVGDFRGWSASDGSKFVDAQAYGQNVVHQWTQVSDLQMPNTNVASNGLPVPDAPQQWQYQSPQIANSNWYTPPLGAGQTFSFSEAQVAMNSGEPIGGGNSGGYQLASNNNPSSSGDNFSDTAGSFTDGQSSTGMTKSSDEVAKILEENGFDRERLNSYETSKGAACSNSVCDLIYAQRMANDFGTADQKVAPTSQGITSPQEPTPAPQSWTDWAGDKMQQATGWAGSTAGSISSWLSGTSPSTDVATNETPSDTADTSTQAPENTHDQLDRTLKADNLANQTTADQIDRFNKTDSLGKTSPVDNTPAVASNDSPEVKQVPSISSTQGPEGVPTNASEEVKTGEVKQENSGTAATEEKPKETSQTWGEWMNQQAARAGNFVGSLFGGSDTNTVSPTEVFPTETPQENPETRPVDAASETKSEEQAPDQGKDAVPYADTSKDLVKGNAVDARDLTDSTNKTDTTPKADEPATDQASAEEKKTPEEQQKIRDEIAAAQGDKKLAEQTKAELEKQKTDLEKDIKTANKTANPDTKDARDALSGMRRDLSAASNAVKSENTEAIKGAADRAIGNVRNLAGEMKDLGNDKLANTLNKYADNLESAKNSNDINSAKSLLSQGNYYSSQAGNYLNSADQSWKSSQTSGITSQLNGVNMQLNDVNASISNYNSRISDLRATETGIASQSGAFAETMQRWGTDAVTNVTKAGELFAGSVGSWVDQSIDYAQKTFGLGNNDAVIPRPDFNEDRTLPSQPGDSEYARIQEELRLAQIQWGLDQNPSNVGVGPGEKVPDQYVSEPITNQNPVKGADEIVQNQPDTRRSVEDIQKEIENLEKYKGPSPLEKFSYQELARETIINNDKIELGERNTETIQKELNTLTAEPSPTKEQTERTDKLLEDLNTQQKNIVDAKDNQSKLLNLLSDGRSVRDMEYTDLKTGKENLEKVLERNLGPNWKESDVYKQPLNSVDKGLATLADVSNYRKIDAELQVRESTIANGLPALQSPVESPQSFWDAARNEIGNAGATIAQGVTGAKDFALSYVDDGIEAYQEAYKGIFGSGSTVTDVSGELPQTSTPDTSKEQIPTPREDPRGRDTTGSTQQPSTGEVVPVPRPKPEIPDATPRRGDTTPAPTPSNGGNTQTPGGGATPAPSGGGGAPGAGGGSPMSPGGGGSGIGSLLGGLSGLLGGLFGNQQNQQNTQNPPVTNTPTCSNEPQMPNVLLCKNGSWKKVTGSAGCIISWLCVQTATTSPAFSSGTTSNTPVNSASTPSPTTSQTLPLQEPKEQLIAAIQPLPDNGATLAASSSAQQLAPAISDADRQIVALLQGLTQFLSSFLRSFSFGR